MIIPASHQGRLSGSDGGPMLNLRITLASLAKRRPIFHSEADFQHELALELKSEFSEIALRLEVPFAFETRGATDILVRHPQFFGGIELKYLTRKLVTDVNGEHFALKAQGATDLRRYDILKDVQRMERLNRDFGGPSYVVALTNDSAYWNKVKTVNTIDAAFRLCEGANVEGVLQWAGHAGAGTTKNRNKPLELAGSYPIRWHDYSDLGLQKGQFRYLLFEVPRVPVVRS